MKLNACTCFLMHYKGCVSGAAISIAVTLFLGIGSTINGLNGNLPNQKLSLQTDGCYMENSTTAGLTNSWVAQQDPFDHQSLLKSSSWKEEEYSTLLDLFSVSYIWHPFVAVVGTVMFGLLFSTIVNCFVEPKHPVKAKYMSPIVVKIWRKVLSDNMFKYWIEDEDEIESVKE